jgi:periplasmic protein TonB
MTPSTPTEIIPEPEIQIASQPEPIEFELREPVPPTPKSVAAPAHRIVEGSFQSSMIELNRMNSGSKLFDILISLTMNLAVLAAPVLAGLYFTDTINLKQLESTFLVAPPPPPPPPAPAVMAVKAPPTRRVFEHAGKLLAPTAIPKNVAEIKEAPLPSDVDGAGGVPGGVPGGVAGGSLGGVIGGIIGGASSAIPAPSVPKESKSRAPVRLGGRVRAPRVIHRVEPAYPPLARQTHTQGTVVIEAVLDESGNVVEMKVISGHGLLIAAALEAVRQWKYEPTCLNEQPVAVQMNINVTFTLSQ